MLCYPGNSGSTCTCGICSTDRCNDDTITTSSEGSGQNATVLAASISSADSSGNSKSAGFKLKTEDSYSIFLIIFSLFIVTFNKI